MTPYISLSFGLGLARIWNFLSLCLFVAPGNTGLQLNKVMVLFYRNTVVVTKTQKMALLKTYKVYKPI